MDIRSRGIGIIYAGGVMGFIQGTSSGTEATVKDCRCGDGDITALRTADTQLRAQTFWTAAPSAGLGFTAGTGGWDFNSVYAKRYPALAGLGGQ
jgi:hypothetical protein